MPVWKPQAAWLREAITSALGQVDCSIELVVIDDGCEPSVAELLDRIDDPRMRVLRVPHGGASLARNAGIEAARGDYIRFVDSDDVLVADSTAHLLTLTGGNDRIITYGATLVCDVGLQPMSTIETGTQGRVAEDCLLNRFATTIHSLLFPRSVVDENGPWESSLVVSEDWDYALRAFERADVRGDRRVATHYRMHSQMNSRNVPEGIRGYRLVVERYFDRHPEQRGGRLQRRAEALYHLFAAVQLATNLGRYRAGLGHLGRAFARDPLTTLAALPRHGAMPLMPAGKRFLGLVPGRWRRRR
jgi:glycosyltransferase involved in cell wall biosynthesis